jgi:hypothetical protein
LSEFGHRHFGQRFVFVMIKPEQGHSAVGWEVSIVPLHGG